MRCTFLLAVASILLMGCGKAGALPTVEPQSELIELEEALTPPAASVRLYTEVVDDLEARRKELGRGWMNATQPGSKAPVLEAARTALHESIVGELIPPWYGTEWAFYGTSQTPGKGEVACGYFVSTVLRDAGLRVERVRLAQQASSHIARTFAGRDTKRFGNTSRLRVVEYVQEQGRGLYVVGLDYHVGLLAYDGEGPVRMCHSSVLFPGSVLCEDAAKSEAMLSEVHVVGEVLTDPVVEAWIEGKAIPTHLP
jgi:hypothetical protein